MIFAYLQLVRAPAGLTAVSNILAAATIASAGLFSHQLGYLIIASLLLYFAGMGLNDCLDYKEDLKEGSNRPIVKGKLSLKNAWFFSLSLMVLGNFVAFQSSLISGYLALALSASILIYNGLIKEGLMGSFCMASCRYLNWLLGASFVGLSYANLSIGLPIFFYIAALTFLSKQESSGKNKNAVYGTALLLSLTLISLIGLICYKFNLNHTELVIAAIILCIASSLIGHKLIKVFKDFTPANIQKMISWMIIGVIPLDAIMLGLSGHYVMGLIVLALLPPCRILNKYLAVT
ncbi:UbiA family prenyltransferase [Catenovulum maritimum]|uniref:Ubiquinone biosynthesis protein UbiA n=1 Tax=Catenovulum maritimum TaxID=1513271 RepID=A0A0J8GRK6_9ALTE|nr:UbiA family prenyltransferase [Catenovulum maritimum]KMT65455.1 hypothetical protein XM47_08865 [Catenovulum maritimum]